MRGHEPASPGDWAARIGRVHVEHEAEAMGIGNARPRLSWVVETDAPGWRQHGKLQSVRAR